LCLSFSSGTEFNQFIAYRDKRRVVGVFIAFFRAPFNQRIIDLFDRCTHAPLSRHPSSTASSSWLTAALASRNIADWTGYARVAATPWKPLRLADGRER
jgi:hypothetical protein